MEQIELFHVESPCRGVCQSSKKGFCKGCLRSREERFHWHEMQDEDKRKVLTLCQHRWQRLLKARQDRLNAVDTSLPYGMQGEDGPEKAPSSDLFD
ncbi:hypothetical protein MED121_08753 [Marinomonas sp. MED121]|uniref:DUF1289 domain-containing protein n=1 Tax=Marinomonas sp. MED121 TaxID=314277 RepID=UPI0000690054|nr:DUF1289 domain-containing protein [Marinomonas sp. MED121]EAQ65641.1 hypothetical protein MED121_08753 [Marinomonas sp. MED121]